MSVNSVNGSSQINIGVLGQSIVESDVNKKSQKSVSTATDIGVSTRALTKTGGVMGGNAESISTNLAESALTAESIQQNLKLASEDTKITQPIAPTYISDNITIRNSSFKVNGCIPSKAITGHPDNNIFITGTSKERKYVTCSSSGCRECNVAGSPEGSGGHETMVDVIRKTKGEAYIDLNLKKADFDNNYGRIDFKLRMTESDPDGKSKYSVKLMYGNNEIRKLEVDGNKENKNDITLSAYAADFVGTSTYDERMLHVELSAEIENGGEIGFGCAELSLSKMDKYEVYEDKVSRGIPAERPSKPEEIVIKPPEEIVVQPPEDNKKVTMTDEEYEDKFESEYNPYQILSIADNLISDDYLSEYMVEGPPEVDDVIITPRKKVIGLDPSRNATWFYIGSDSKAYRDESGDARLAEDSIIAIDNKYFRVNSNHECEVFTPKKVVGYINKVPKDFISIDNLTYDPINFSRPPEGTAIIGGGRCFLMVGGKGVEIQTTDPRHPFYKKNSSVSGVNLATTVTTADSFSNSTTAYMGVTNSVSTLIPPEPKGKLTNSEKVRNAIYNGVNQGLMSTLSTKGVQPQERQVYSDSLKSELVRFAKSQCEDNSKAWCDFALTGRYNCLDFGLSSISGKSIENARTILDNARAVFINGERRGANINECISEASVKAFIELKDFKGNAAENINDIRNRINRHLSGAHRPIDDSFTNVSQRLVNNLKVLKVSSYRELVNTNTVKANYVMGVVSGLVKQAGDAFYNVTTKEGRKVLKKFVVDSIMNVEKMARLTNPIGSADYSLKAINPNTKEGKELRESCQQITNTAKAIYDWAKNTNGNTVAFETGEFTSNIITGILVEKGATALTSSIKLGKFAEYAEKITKKSGSASEIADGIVEGAGKVVFETADEYFGFISNIGKRADLTKTQKLEQILEAYKGLKNKGDVTVVSDARYLTEQGFDLKTGRMLVDWPPKMGFAEDSIKSITRNNPLPDKWDRVGGKYGENFTVIPKSGVPYNYNQRAIPYLENTSARHVGDFKTDSYFNVIDAIRNNNLDELNKLVSINGKKPLSTLDFDDIKAHYNDFIKNAKTNIGEIDATYGLKGNAAPWRSSRTNEVLMSGGAEQFVTPLNADMLEMLGVIPKY